MAPTNTNAAVGPPRNRAVPQAVKKAIETMRAGLAQRITAAELARVSGVPERTLHRQFIAFMGHSPLTHFRLMRLAAARRALLDGVPSVTGVAAQFGFAHFGRFSSDYQRRFGELPSATLARGRATAAEAVAGATMRPNGVAQPTAPLIRRQAPSLAILLFRTDGGTLAERVLAEGLMEQLAIRLSRTHAFSVRVMRHAAQGGTRDFSARYCLTGRIARSPEGRVRVLVRLLDLAAGGLHLWGDAYDGTAADPFGLQDRVVEGVTCAIQPGIQEAEIERALRKPARDLDTYDLVQRALPLILAADPTSALRALGPLEEAMGLDPDDPTPIALAGWCRAQLVLYQATSDPSAERSRALRLADRAAALDPIGDPMVLTARGSINMMALQREDAETLLVRAQAIDPSFAWAWERSAWMMVNRGEAETALGHFQRAMPLKGAHAPTTNCMAGVGTAHYSAGRYAEAASWIGRALAGNPSAVWLNRVLAPCYLALGERQAAGAALERLRHAYPAITVERVVSGLPTFCGDQARRADGPIPDGLAALGLPP